MRYKTRVNFNTPRKSGRAKRHADISIYRAADIKDVQIYLYEPGEKYFFANVWRNLVPADGVLTAIDFQKRRFLVCKDMFWADSWYICKGIE